MKWINLCKICIIICLIIFIAGCNKKQESIIISEKQETDVKFYGKIREVNVYYSNPINLCFDIEIDSNVLTSVNSMDVEFYIGYRDSMCGFYNFYRIENNLLSICIYTDLLNCHNINDEILTNKQKRKGLFNEMKFYIFDKKGKRKFDIDLSHAKIIFNKVDDNYQRPL